MDDLLCLVRRVGSSAQFRVDIVLRHGLCRYGGHGLGLDYCHGLHPVRRYGDGYVGLDVGNE